MASEPRRPAGPHAAGGAMITTLYAMAFVTGAMTLVAVLFEIAAALNRSEPVSVDKVMGVLTTGVLGVAMALLLAAIGVLLGLLQALLHMMHRLVRSQEDCTAYVSRLSTNAPTVPAPAESASAPTSWADAQKIDQIVEVLGEISDNLLLAPEQRVAKRQQQLADARRQIGEAISHLLAEGNFVDAQRRLEEYARLFPEDRRQVDQFQGQVDEARARAEETDYQAAAAKVRELMTLAAWDRADEVVHDLLVRHPRSSRAHDLVESLRQERHRFEQQQRQHSLARIEELGAQKQWREAHRLAGELVARHGDSAEAQAIRSKMDTLRENAEIEIRRELEGQLKELVRSHRYIEALAMAQDVVAKYPNSPQAKALREQMPQLMSKAKVQMDQGARG